MFGIDRPQRFGAGVVCALLLARSLPAQGTPPASGDGPGAAARMESYDGTRYSVRYFSKYRSPGESSTVRELERLENESAYLRNLQSLKEQYVASERLLETHRRLVQMQLYGTDTTRSAFSSVYASSYGYGAAGY